MHTKFQEISYIYNTVYENRNEKLSCKTTVVFVLFFHTSLQWDYLVQPSRHNVLHKLCLHTMHVFFCILVLCKIFIYCSYHVAWKYKLVHHHTHNNINQNIPIHLNVIMELHFDTYKIFISVCTCHWHRTTGQESVTWC